MSYEALVRRFHEVNGVHPMTAADDEYVSKEFRVLTELCAEHGRDVDEVRRLMVAGELPLPGYLRSDGAEMVPANLFAYEGRREWFVAQWDDPAEGAAEWDGYLRGHFVCLRTVTPETIKRKGELIEGIKERPDPELVEELDRLLADFTGYDRLRFGGPVSRDLYVTPNTRRVST